jgi:hypothetical protein
MTEQETIYQEVSGLLAKLFEIDPQEITLRLACMRIWSWTASMR